MEEQKPSQPEQTNGQQNEPVNSKRPKASRKVLALFILCLVTLVAVSGFLFYLLNDKQQLIESKDQQISDLILKASRASETADDAGTKNTADNPDATNDNDTNQVKLPVVVFTPEGLFDDAEKTEISNKLIQPYIDLKKEDGTVNQTVSIHVQHPTEGDTNKEYSVDIISEGGAYEGFLYGDSTKTTQPWYEPVCFEGCEFSEAYQQKYPELIEQYNNPK